MDTTSVVVVGAGPAGLAVSGCLTEAGVDHVILERHQVGHSWRRERWDTLRTLTPNWMNGLPRLPYRGPDPDGFMTAIEVADLVVTYAGSIAAPVVTGTAVAAIRTGRRGHVVEADTGRWAADAIVLATGPGESRVPALAAELPARIRQVCAVDYRNPAQLDGDRVLIVGASASGVQIADEVARSGRHVTLAVGEHVRLPRTYRGRDILWWMQAMGVSSRRWDDDIDDLTRARQVPSPQLIGTPERRTLDLGALRRAGVELVGRLVGVSGGRLQCAGSLANLVANADLKQARLLDQVDEFIAQARIAASRPDRPQATDVTTPPTSLDSSQFDTVVWATGHRHSPPQLDPVHLDRWTRIVHDGGILRTPGLFAVGLPFLRRRSSTFLSGIARDAVELSIAIRQHLDRVAAAA
jgi:putative flavoprotein involved in K+ transport